MTARGRRRPGPAPLLVATGLLLLLASSAPGALRGAACFAGVRAPGAGPRRTRPAVQRRAANADDIKAAISPAPTEYLFGGDVDEEELEAAARRVAGIGGDQLWDVTDFKPMQPTTVRAGETYQQPPKYERWISAEQFRAAAKRLGADSSDTALEYLFIALAGGLAGFAPKERVDTAFKEWGTGDSFNPGAFQSTVFTAKAQVGFAVWFLNIFAPFCTYYFFLRAPIITYLGIDLLPMAPKWWDRAPPPADAVAAAAAAAAAAAGAGPGL